MIKEFVPLLFFYINTRARFIKHTKSFGKESNKKLYNISN